MWAEAGQSETTVEGDRPYTSMEIQKMLEKADERERAVILLMVSTGM